MVGSQVQLAEDVEIGPQCHLSGRIQLGSGTRLHGHNYLRGPLVMGQHNTVYPFASLGLEPQDRKFDPQREGPGLVIADHNVIRESVTIHRATRDHPTTIGSHNYFMVNSHVGHDCIVGNHCTLVNNSALGGHVDLQDHVIIGGNGAVHQFCRVGRLAMLSGNAGVTQDIPPFCVAYVTRYVSSLNYIGLRRAGLHDHVPALEEAFKWMFRRRLPTPRAVNKILEELGHDPLCRELAEFAAQTKRGVCAYTAKQLHLDDERYNLTLASATDGR